MPPGDLSWLWEVLKSIVDTIKDWFSKIWEQAQNITNTGQGLFAGLSAFGSALWDAIVSFGEMISGGFLYAFDKIKKGLENFGSYIWGAFLNGLQAIGAGLGWIANQFYGFGQWLYNGISWVAKVVGNVIAGIVDWFGTVLSDLLNTLGSWYENVRNGINQWFTGIFTGIRSKLKHSIIASLTITVSYKSLEGLHDAKGWFDYLKVVVNPVLGYLGSYFIAELIDKLIPTPSTSVFEVCPPIAIPSYTPPKYSYTLPPEPVPPETPPAPPPIYAYYPVIDVEVEVKSEYEHVWMPEKALSGSITTSYEVVVS